MRISYLPYKIFTALLLLLLSINIYNVSAKTAGLTIEQISDKISLTMDSGSSIRLVEGSTGLRFVSHINNDSYLTLKDDYHISLGTIVVPKDYINTISDTTFTKHYLENNNIDFLNISQKNWFSIDESKNVRYFSAVITNILTKNLARDFIARSYCDIEINGISNTIYATNSFDNARNLYNLSQVVLENDSLSLVQKDILYSILNRVGISFTILTVNSETDLTFQYDHSSNFYLVDYAKQRKYLDYICFTISPKNNKYSLNKIENIFITGKGKTTSVTHNSNGTISFLYSIDSYINSNLH